MIELLIIYILNITNINWNALAAIGTCGAVMVALLLPFLQKSQEIKEKKRSISLGLTQEIIENIRRAIFKGELKYQSMFFHMLKENSTLINNWNIYIALSELYLYMDYIEFNSPINKTENTDLQVTANLYMKLSLISKTSRFFSKYIEFEKNEELDLHLEAYKDINGNPSLTIKDKRTALEATISIIGIILDDEYMEQLRLRLNELFSKMY